MHFIEYHTGRIINFPKSYNCSEDGQSEDNNPIVEREVVSIVLCNNCLLRGLLLFCPFSNEISVTKRELRMKEEEKRYV